MKKLVIALVAVMLSLSAIAQSTTQDTLPTALRNDFSSKFTDASAMEWSIADSIYTGTFTSNGERHIVEYTASGRMRSHRYTLKKEQYPAAMVAVLKKDYGSHQIDDVDYVEKEGVVSYEVDLDGKPDYTLTFDQDGKLLSSRKK